MNGAESWGWPALLLLGAYHGINPGMGWLFAVALGMQERRRAAVAWSLVPITLGHALAIAVAIAVAGVLGMVVSLGHLKLIKTEQPDSPAVLEMEVYRETPRKQKVN